MSVFTSFVSQILTVPDSMPGAGQTITIRKLASRHLYAADVENTFKTIDFMKRAGPQFIKEMRAVTKEQIEKEQEVMRQERAADPLAAYDTPTLILKAVKSWTLLDDAGAVTPLPKDRDEADDLDEEFKHWLATAALKLARPKLYQTPEVVETERKNG